MGRGASHALAQACGYDSHGGDCANFVSQCLVSAGHPYLVGFENCRGYPCGREEPGARNLDDCLAEHFGWHRECGEQLEPPSWVSVGDVAIFHASSCDDEEAHATIVTSTHGGNVLVSCHSPATLDGDYSQA